MEGEKNTPADCYRAPSKKGESKPLTEEKNTLLDGREGMLPLSSFLFTYRT